MLSTNDLKNQLNIGRDAAYSLMRSRFFPSIRIGCRYYVNEESLKKWIATQEKKKNVS